MRDESEFIKFVSEKRNGRIKPAESVYEEI